MVPQAKACATIASFVAHALACDPAQFGAPSMRHKPAIVANALACGFARFFHSFSGMCCSRFLCRSLAGSSPAELTDLQIDRPRLPRTEAQVRAPGGKLGDGHGIFTQGLRQIRHGCDPVISRWHAESESIYAV